MKNLWIFLLYNLSHIRCHRHIEHTCADCDNKYTKMAYDGLHHGNGSPQVPDSLGTDHMEGFMSLDQLHKLADNAKDEENAANTAKIAAELNEARIAKKLNEAKAKEAADKAQAANKRLQKASEKAKYPPEILSKDVAPVTVHPTGNGIFSNHNALVMDQTQRIREHELQIIENQQKAPPLTDVTSAAHSHEKHRPYGPGEHLGVPVANLEGNFYIPAGDNGEHHEHPTFSDDHNDNTIYDPQEYDADNIKYNPQEYDDGIYVPNPPVKNNINPSPLGSIPPNPANSVLPDSNKQKLYTTKKKSYKINTGKKTKSKS